MRKACGTLAILLALAVPSACSDSTGGADAGEAGDAVDDAGDAAPETHDVAPDADDAASGDGADGEDTDGETVCPPDPPPTPETCEDPPLLAGPPGDATEDAAGLGQRFERVSIPGLTDGMTGGTGAVALVDLDRDGRIDIWVQEQPRTQSRAAALFLNRGCFRFEAHDLEWSGIDLGPTHSHPAFADFDDDGWLDILVTRSNVGGSRSALYLADGRFDAWRLLPSDVSGISTDGEYNRGAAFGDLDGDGRLDIAVASDKIGVTGSRSVQHLYRYVPGTGSGFEDGRFEDIATSVEGFGWAGPECNPERQRGAPAILLRDLDDDGDLDVLQGAHRDLNGMRPADADDPCGPGEWAQGVFAWRNRLRETGDFALERVAPGAEGGFADGDEVLPEVARGTWNAGSGYSYEGRGVGLPYVSTADVDNDGDLDVVAVGPTDPEWHAQVEPIAGKFWRNDGDWRFVAATDSTGLDALNWTYREWASFFDFEMITESPFIDAACARSFFPPDCSVLEPADHHFYSADALFADFDNDGWVDLVLADRHELENGEQYLRNVFFHNDGDGTFTPETTDRSGIDASSVSAEAADLDGDGLLDLYLVASPNNSTSGPDILTLHPDRYPDKVYWNTGAFGARDNHWVRLRLQGRPSRQLVGARVFAQVHGTRTCEGSGEARTCIGRRDYLPVTSYKSTHELEVHFGLGARTEIDVRVELPDGTTVAFACVPIDGLVVLDVGTGEARRWGGTP
ncbi:MAG: CRTAC1 family protein [Deltaproteobacteria bacterium]|nr:CRTAC1 family protein [Deltaproteobacteria bacterium]